MDRFLISSGLIIFIGLAGYTAGRVVTLRQFTDPPFHMEPDLRPRIPVVQFEGIQEGVVTGRISGDVRVFWGERMILPDGSGAFRVAGDLLVEEVAVPVPDGMQFVASRKGKKYYPVASPLSERIKPENRLYFPTADAAEAYGFLP